MPTLEIVTKALAELREHIVSGVPVGGIDLAALDQFVFLFREDFESILDEGGAAKWRADRKKVLSAGRALGQMAAFSASMKGRATVKADDLMDGLRAVKPHCLALVPADRADMLRIYCARVDPGPAPAARRGR